jgi:hypothetical protein
MVKRQCLGLGPLKTICIYLAVQIHLSSYVVGVAKLMGDGFSASIASPDPTKNCIMDFADGKVPTQFAMVRTRIDNYEFVGIASYTLRSTLDKQDLGVSELKDSESSVLVSTNGPCGKWKCKRKIIHSGFAGH